MGFKGITVNTSPEAEPHIYAEDDAAIYQSIVGSDGVMSIGQQFKATVLTNNKIRIGDGVLFVGGHFARTPYAAYDDMEVANGRSGMNRNDLIVARIESTGSGGIDTMELKVLQGTATVSTATDPAITQEEMYGGGKVREYPLYRVKLEGLTIKAVEALYDIIPTIPNLNDEVKELRGSYKRFATSDPGMITLPNGAKMVFGLLRASEMSSDSNVGGYAKTISLSKYNLTNPVWALASARYASGFPQCAVCTVNASELKLSCDVNVSQVWIQWIVIG